MKKTSLYRGFTSLCAVLLVLFVFGTSVALDYEKPINTFLHTQSSKIITTGEVGDTQYYKSDYGDLNAENLQKLIADTYEQNVTEMQEGAVLLKNDNSALPLESDENSITLFGHAVAQAMFKAHSAGSNSAYGHDNTKAPYCTDLYEAFAQHSFEINDTLYNAYKNSSTRRINRTHELGEETIDFYTSNLRASWQTQFNDVAVVMFAREGGEGIELEMCDSEGISQLALHQAEKDLLQMIKDSGVFSKTIVLLNSPWAMELGWLDEYEVDACLWIGNPGMKGFEGVIDILVGEVSPSGRLVDTYATNSMSAPACVNNSCNNQTWSNLSEVSANLQDSDFDISYYAFQAESIYIGYRYYETRYEDCILNRYNASTDVGSSFEGNWNYAKEVVYPFGYGLSYTTFTQKLNSVVVRDGVATANVTVKNTGSTAGKNVVQLYAQTPYGDYEIANKVEKSAIQLAGFAKTDLLQPNQEQTLTITVDMYLLASYDYVNAKGYVLSQGQYYFAIGDNAHDALNNVLAEKGASGMVDSFGNAVTGDSQKVVSWNNPVLDKTTYKTAENGVVVTNQFDDCDVNFWTDTQYTYLSRSNWSGTYPVAPAEIECTLEMQDQLDGDTYVKPDDAPSAMEMRMGLPKDSGLTLVMMRDVDYDDPLWETFLNQLTASEMVSLISCYYGTGAVTSIGKPEFGTGDGPDGVGPNDMAGNYPEKYGDTRSTCCYTGEVVLCSTFNVELYQSRGKLMAEEALYMGFMEVWCPGGNLHRTPFCGRNFEYYSEDPNLSYLASIPQVKAMEEKGVHAGIKHFAGNDQENNREGISVFFNEQAFREGSLRAFEGAVRVGKTLSIMQSFNRLGLEWASSKSQLNFGILAQEWGFLGHTECDAIQGGQNTGYKSHLTTSLSSGTDTYCLDDGGRAAIAISKYISESDDGYMLLCLRRAVKNYLYACSRSCVINGLSSNTKIVPATPWWKATLYGTIVVFALGTVAFGTLYVISKINKGEQKNEVE
ncbi:MAG: glycoside hydrolase family 3 C-terminal domain-containing protein [Clostridia bacterium]|nr:glycoside hydrolase family 3 C-terminal domain-containing protein [Clostridia bacterium]